MSESESVSVSEPESESESMSESVSVRAPAHLWSRQHLPQELEGGNTHVSISGQMINRTGPPTRWDITRPREGTRHWLALQRG